MSQYLSTLGYVAFLVNVLLNVVVVEISSCVIIDEMHTLKVYRKMCIYRRIQSEIFLLGLKLFFNLLIPYVILCETALFDSLSSVK